MFEAVFFLKSSLDNEIFFIIQPLDQASSNNAQILGWLAFDVRSDMEFSEQRQKTAGFKITLFGNFIGQQKCRYFNKKAYLSTG